MGTSALANSDNIVTSPIVASLPVNTKPQSDMRVREAWGSNLPRLAALALMLACFAQSRSAIAAAADASADTQSPDLLHTTITSNRSIVIEEYVSASSREIFPVADCHGMRRCTVLLHRDSRYRIAGPFITRSKDFQLPQLVAVAELGIQAGGSRQRRAGLGLLITGSILTGVGALAGIAFLGGLAASGPMTTQSCGWNDHGTCTTYTTNVGIPWAVGTVSISLLIAGLPMLIGGSQLHRANATRVDISGRMSATTETALSLKLSPTMALSPAGLTF